MADIILYYTDSIIKTCIKVHILEIFKDLLFFLIKLKAMISNIMTSETSFYFKVNNIIIITPQRVSYSQCVLDDSLLWNDIPINPDRTTVETKRYPAHCFHIDDNMVVGHYHMLIKLKAMISNIMTSETSFYFKVNNIIIITPQRPQ
jgi:hypothetical protein